MANILELRQKVGSLRGMQKVMRAMNMISTIKLRKHSPFLAPTLQFENIVEEILKSILQISTNEHHPVLYGYQEKGNAHIILVSADKGLCGSHNANLFRALDHLLITQSDLFQKANIFCIGNKARNFCRKKDYPIFFHSPSGRELSDKVISELSDTISKDYLSGNVTKVILIYNRYHSVIFQKTVIFEIFPMVKSSIIKKEILNKPSEAINNSVFQSEPDSALLLDSLAKTYLQYRLQIALSHSCLSEHASRMTAMENATVNADLLIGKYNTLLNRARQSVITNEIIEIISGKEAMKGNN